MLCCLDRGVGVWMEQEAFRGHRRRGAGQKSVGVSAGLVRNQMSLPEVRSVRATAASLLNTSLQ